jgi:aspartyl-tRNA(Asn)/glutamyl-tRNA(Gln) amidotransferase subunit C
MMEIRSTEVEQIARLARLELAAAEVDDLAHDLASILGHMEALREVDISEAPPMEGVSEHPAPFRADDSHPDALARPVGSFAPAMGEGFFVVPRLAALDGDSVDHGDSA